MARAKKNESAEAENRWAAYFAIQLTPEEKAAARAQAQEHVDQARRDGAYERLRALRGTIQFKYTWEDLREDED